MRTTLQAQRAWPIILASLSAASMAEGQCSRWMPAPALTPEGWGRAMLVHDLDGAGPLPPQLIVGGRFERAGGPGPEGVLARNVAAWNGTDWTPLGPGLNSVPHGIFEVGGVYTLASYGGAVYAGGNFGLGASFSRTNVARYDGTNWIGTGSQFDRPVNAMVVYAGELVVGGEFTTIGSVSARCVAAWNGASWRPLGSGLRGRDDSVQALAVFGGELIAAGAIDTAGAVSTPGIARWNGSRWASLAGGVGTSPGERVRALAVYGGELIAGGYFHSVDGSAVEAIARWNGSRWATLPDLRGEVQAFTLWNGGLVAAGFLDSPSDTTIQSVARWDGAHWTSFGEAHQVGGNLFTAGTFGGGLYVGGSVSSASGADAKGITTWSGTSWTNLPGLVRDDTIFPNVSSMAVWNGALMAGGLFNLVDENNLLRWTGGPWPISPVSPDGAVMAMLPVSRGANVPEDLVIAGDFTNANFQDPHERVVTLTTVTDAGGRVTRRMGAGFNAAVRALTRFNGLTVAAGDFTASGATGINRLARWDGAAWQPLDALGGLNGGVRGMKAFSPSAIRVALVVGGSFTTAGGAPANRIAQYTVIPATGAASWAALGAGLNGQVLAVERFGGTIYAGGSFTADGNGVPLSFVARFVGGAWQQVGAGLNGTVSSLFTDGVSLYAGGTFTSSGGTPVTNLARWDGAAWSAVDGGANGRIAAITVYQDELMAGGFFTRVGPGSGGGPRAGAVESPLSPATRGPASRGSRSSSSPGRPPRAGTTSRSSRGRWRQGTRTTRGSHRSGGRTAPPSRWERPPGGPTAVPAPRACSSRACRTRTRACTTAS